MLLTFEHFYKLFLINNFLSIIGNFFKKNVMSLAGRANPGLRRIRRNLHPAMAIIAFEAFDTRDLAIAAADFKDFALDKRLSGFTTCGFDYPAEGLPRYVHPFRRLFLIKPFEVRQLQSF